MTITRLSFCFGGDSNPNKTKCINCIQLNVGAIFVVMGALNITSNITQFSLQYQMSNNGSVMNVHSGKVLFKRNHVMRAAETFLVS
jgi:hypothetical protein